MGVESSTAASQIVQQGVAVVEGEQPGAVAVVVAPVNTSFADEDARLAELLKQAEDEDAAKAAGATQVGDAGSAATPPAQAPAADAGVAAPPAKAGTTQAVPIEKDGAVIALRRQLRESKDRELVLQGTVQALQPLAQARVATESGGQVQQQEQADPIEAELESIDTEQLRLAGEFQEGRLTATDWETQKIALNKRERELTREQAARFAQSVAAKAPAAPVNDLAMEQHLNQLFVDYPFLQTKTAAQLDPFNQLAYEKARAEGNPIQPGPAGTVRLRTMMAELAEQFYDQPNAMRKQQAREQAAGSAKPQVQQPAGKPAPVQPTAAQRDAKLTLRQSMPPDVSSLGTGAVAGEMTEAEVAVRVAAMNDEEVQKFMDANPALISKIMGGSTQRAGTR